MPWIRMEIWKAKQKENMSCWNQKQEIEFNIKFSFNVDKKGNVHIISLLIL